ncbi:unnamed protein product [Prorocentrum cordatum]|uniref:Uncharacterized protein n=1 Tax=Prorocentrum cordatum TaxID=2364126 RepID=A0ABN9QGL2_9DINO|nr:unnamed protein product [Polarella glacialis]
MQAQEAVAGTPEKLTLGHDALASEVSKRQVQAVATPMKQDPAARHAGGPAMDIGLFYAFGQCSLKMEARHHMERDFELRDEAAKKVWPEYERLALRNLGSNEKWVPWHTVLGVHELFLVKSVHGANVPWWTDYHRFVAMFLFRCHCKMDLFLEVQMPHLSKEAFWRDLEASFAPESQMEKDIAKFRSSTGRALQTACFLIIPERLLKDDDANLIRNIVLRSQRLVGLANHLWPLVNDEKTSVNEKYDAIRQAILGVRNLGDTWVKMLMVCMDICLPGLGLLTSRCEVGVGAADPLRKLLVEEGLLAPPPPPRLKVDAGLESRKLAGEAVKVEVSLRSGIVAVKRSGVQLIQVTTGMAGSLDRAHAVAEELKRLAIDQDLQRKDQEVLSKRRQELFADTSLEVPRLDLDAKREELIAGGAPPPRKREGPSPSDALMALGARINESDIPSAGHFWELLAEVEAHGRTYFESYPLIVAQMKTKARVIHAATLQVQLCEFRQFESFLRQAAGKRARADGGQEAKQPGAPEEEAAAEAGGERGRARRPGARSGRARPEQPAPAQDPPGGSPLAERRGDDSHWSEVIQMAVDLLIGPEDEAAV